MRDKWMVRLGAALLTLAATVACTEGGGGDDEGFDGGVGADAGNTPPPSERREDRGDFLVFHETDVSVETEGVAGFVQSRQLAENLAAAINRVFALPKDVEFWTGDCGVTNAYWSVSDNQIVMCNELTLHMANTFVRVAPNFTQEQLNAAVHSTWLFVAYHEVGHALIDIFSLPITGREEDAVDDLATVILVAGGLGDAALVAAQWFAASAQDGQASTLAGQHGLNQQRFYNILCTVYGSDPDRYQSLATTFPEMQNRLPRCEAEYQQKRSSWNRLLAEWRK